MKIKSNDEQMEKKSEIIKLVDCYENIERSESKYEETQFNKEMAGKLEEETKEMDIIPVSQHATTAEIFLAEKTCANDLATGENTGVGKKIEESAKVNENAVDSSADHGRYNRQRTKNQSLKQEDPSASHRTR